MSLKQWRSRLPDKLTTRFAPSPGGWLHLGHVLSAMYVWGLGRALGAKIILRIEDHDISRARPDYEQGILDALDWLGCDADEGVDAISAVSMHRQSDHLEDYGRALEQLRSAGLIYQCSCTRKEIEARQGVSTSELRYDGYCAHRQLGSSTAFATRLRTDASEISFNDGLLGPLGQNPRQQCGDWVLLDRHGHYSYNFAVVVDDLRDQVNLVIRGEDLVHTTGRQLFLRQQLAAPSEVAFFHHPLIKEHGRKLSKRDGALGVLQLKKQGYSAQDLWILASQLTGLPKFKNLQDATGYFSALCDGDNGHSATIR